MSLENTILNIQSWLVEFFHSGAFSVIKFILGIYAVVLLADIVLLLFQRGLMGDIKDTFLGMNIPAELVSKKKKNKLRERWFKIKEKLEIENEDAWKVAVIEGDELIDDLLRRMGYPGANMGERLVEINSGQIENVEELKKAHEFRNRIIREKDFKITREETAEILKYYENFLIYFDTLAD